VAPYPTPVSEEFTVGAQCERFVWSSYALYLILMKFVLDASFQDMPFWDTPVDRPVRKDLATFLAKQCQKLILPSLCKLSVAL
jgi:hypothetical protein